MPRLDCRINTKRAPTATPEDDRGEIQGLAPPLYALLTLIRHTTCLGESNVCRAEFWYVAWPRAHPPTLVGGSTTGAQRWLGSPAGILEEESESGRASVCSIVCSLMNRALIVPTAKHATAPCWRAYSPRAAHVHSAPYHPKSSPTVKRRRTGKGEEAGMPTGRPPGE